MQARRRLRRKSLLIWGLATFIPCLFIFLNTYNAVILAQQTPELSDLAKVDAFKACFLPILVVQALILLFLGTGSIAGTLSEEKESGLLDYHRVTPMTPAQKTVGYLLGLPCREYLMFAITLPFTVISTVGGNLPVGKVLLLYSILLCNAFTYHLTSMVAGLLARRPRLAGWLARLMVVAIFLFIPILGQLGFAILGHITFIPTLYGLFKEELAQTNFFQDKEYVAIWETVPFYYWELPPALFSFVILGLLMVMFSYILLRKWKKDSYHPFTKVFAILVFGVIQFFAVGSITPLLYRNDPELAGIFNHLHDIGGILRYFYGAEPDTIFQTVPWNKKYTSLLYGHLMGSGALIVWLLHIVTPYRATAIGGLRRARKLGLEKIPFNWDAAPSLWVCLVLIATALLGYLSLAFTGPMLSGEYDFARPSPRQLAAAGFTFLCVTLYVQGARTIWERPGWLGFLALMWIVPMLCGMTLSAFVQEAEPTAYIGIPNPGIAIGHILSPPFKLYIIPDTIGSLKVPAVVGFIFHTALAIFFQSKAHHWRRDLDPATSEGQIGTRDATDLPDNDIL